jgi:integrase
MSTSKVVYSTSGKTCSGYPRWASSSVLRSRTNRAARFRFLQPRRGCSEATARIRLLKHLRLAPAWIDSGLVFTSTVGTVIEPRNLNRFFDELITKAGVRRIRFHDLRHTCASLLLAQNVPARVVMEIIGHSQLAMTTDLYSHVMPTALRAAADAMDRLLLQPN